MASFLSPNFFSTGNMKLSTTPGTPSRQQTSETNLQTNRYTSPQTTSFTPPPTAFPSWLPTKSQFGELQSTWKGIPQAFDTSGMESSYNRMIGNNMAAGTAMSAANARAAQNRARQTGGGVAASFAQGSAMQGVRRQGAEMLSDLEQKKLAAKQSMIAAQMQTAGALGQGRLSQQGQLMGYDQGMRNQYLQGQQLGMEQQRIGLQGQGLQLEADRMAQQGDQFNRQLAQQAQDSGERNRIAALAAIPTPHGSWRENGQGQPISWAEQQRKNQYQSAMDDRAALISRIARSGAQTMGGNLMGIGTRAIQSAASRY